MQADPLLSIRQMVGKSARRLSDIHWPARRHRPDHTGALGHTRKVPDPLLGMVPDLHFPNSPSPITERLPLLHRLDDQGLLYEIPPLLGFDAH